MMLSAGVIELRRSRPFKISRSEASTHSRSLIVGIGHGGLAGLGECVPSEYYHGETIEGDMAVMDGAGPLLGDDPLALDEVIDGLARAFPDSPAAVAGMDMALHDLAGKMLGVPLWRHLGLDPGKAPCTSYTIGLDAMPGMLEAAREAVERGFPVLKVKVGTPDDVRILRAIRDLTDAPIRLDANTAWTVEEAIERIGRLRPFGIEFVEQPIPPGDPEGLKKVRDATGVPIMADEDAVTSADIPRLEGCVDAINVKLMKCGGIREALRMIRAAHERGILVMLGCMAESSLSITAAAQLSPLVEYADLDSNLRMANDPFDGVRVENGRLLLPNGPGIGVVPKGDGRGIREGP